MANEIRMIYIFFYEMWIMFLYWQKFLAAVTLIHILKLGGCVNECRKIFTKKICNS